MSPNSKSEKSFTVLDGPALVGGVPRRLIQFADSRAELKASSTALGCPAAALLKN